MTTFTDNMNNPFINLNALDGKRYGDTFAKLLYIHPVLHPLSSNKFSMLTAEEKKKIRIAVGSKSTKLIDIWNDACCYVTNYFGMVL